MTTLEEDRTRDTHASFVDQELLGDLCSSGVSSGTGEETCSSVRWLFSSPNRFRPWCCTKCMMLMTIWTARRVMTGDCGYLQAQFERSHCALSQLRYIWVPGMWCCPLHLLGLGCDTAGQAASSMRVSCPVISVRLTDHKYYVSLSGDGCSHPLCPSTVCSRISLNWHACRFFMLYSSRLIDCCPRDNRMMRLLLGRILW